MAEYDATIKAKVAFPPTTLVNTLGEVVAKAGLLQLRIAETEKYAHEPSVENRFFRWRCNGALCCWSWYHWYNSSLFCF